MAETKDARDAIFDFCTSDFATVVKTTAFVDKTVMIKDVFDATDAAFLLITAPPRSGKSTNLDMVRRFLEIQVDNYGNRQPLAQTNNYKLFTENDLGICKLTNFLKRHFGKYPVLYMDWKPLGEVSDYVSMIDVFKTITMGLFELRRYFLKMPNVWTDDLKIEDFKSYCYPTGNSFYSENKIICGFQRLSRLLFRHFDKKVFVLIDNCDAFVASDLFRKNGEDGDKMLRFIQTVVDSLLKNNQCVGRALLTGVLPLTGDGFPFGRDKIRCYSFMYSGPFYTYYGLTVEELDGILEKLETDNNERNETKRDIETFFSPYTAGQCSNKIYHILSVLKYLRTKEFSVANKYRMPNFSALYKYPKIHDELVHALMGNESQFDISQPLSIKDVAQLNSLIETGSDKDVSASTVNTVLKMLSHFGYLSVASFAYCRIATFVIPDEGNKQSLANDILETNQELFCRTWNHADKVCSAVYSIKSDNTADVVSFEDALTNWYRNLTPCPLNVKKSLSTRLFMILLASPIFERTVLSKRCPAGQRVILLQTLDYECVSLTVRVYTSDLPTEEALRNTAEIACNNVAQLCDFTDVEKVCIIGIGYSPETRSCKVHIVNIRNTESEEMPSSSPNVA